MRIQSIKLCARCSAPVKRRRFTYCTPKCRGLAQRESRSWTDRFWPKVNEDGPILRPELGQCWIWTGSRGSNGYGRFRLENEQVGAHVAAYIILTGHKPPPEAPHVTHLCDGGALGCVRPSHLMADTNAGNAAQAVERGRVFRGEAKRALMLKVVARGERHGSRTKPERIARGERSGSARLTDVSVREIRAEYAAGGVSQESLARRYHVSRRAISLLLSGQTWAHVR